MKLKTLEEIEETSGWDPTLDCLCHVTHAEILRKEAIKWIKTIREGVIITDTKRNTAANNEPDFILMKFFNITEEDL